MDYRSKLKINLQRISYTLCRRRLRLIELGFNGTFSTVRLYRALDVG